MFQCFRLQLGLNLPFIQASDISNSLPKSQNTTCVMCAWTVQDLNNRFSSIVQVLTVSNHQRPDHLFIVILIQSERLKHSISPRNQSAKYPDSGCFSISGVVIGSALSKGWRSGPRGFSRGSLYKT